MNKNPTTIGKRVFIGSDTALVAPVRVGDGAYVGAGSVVTEDVPADALAIARGHQVNKPGWAAARARQSAGIKIHRGENLSARTAIQQKSWTSAHASQTSPRQQRNLAADSAASARRRLSGIFAAQDTLARCARIFSGRFRAMKFGVVVFPGSNCDDDAFHAVGAVLGQPVEFIWHHSEQIPGCDAIILPGGFAFGDYLRTGAIARFSPVMRAVERFARCGGLVLGICNGFQILLEAGLLPGAMLRNRDLRFICRQVIFASKIPTRRSPARRSRARF